jgi:D-alanyl-D-alanine carboxypeptidase/D-alanyl-D-alanine-endopeptidase (penicillin-binding protein 4)
LLEENGIEIGEQPKGCREMEINTNPSDYQKRVLIGTHEGNSLEQIITETNHRSINLFAEHMLNLIGFEETGDGRTTAGIQVFDAFWKNKINTTGLHLNDGSGLSRTNAISANHFIEFLTYMHSDATFAKTFRASLPVAGQSGTMRYICRNQAGHGRISAKSGSMTRIRSYAGYVSTATGKELAFAIIVNNYDGSSSSLKNRFQQLMNAMASY